MGINGVKATNYYKMQNIQENRDAARKSIVFTNATDIGKALSSGSINVDGVSIELSEEAKQALMDARERLYADRDAEAERYAAEFNGYVAKQQAEACEDMSEDMAKAMETARRISRGDIVPAIDEQKLMEFSQELYQMAKSAAMLHQMEEHQKDKSLYENEKEREYTDPLEETALQQQYGVAVEVSLGDVPAVESVSEGEIPS